MPTGFEKLLQVLLSKGIQTAPEDIADALWLSTRLFDEIKEDSQPVVYSESESQSQPKLSDTLDAKQDASPKNTNNTLEGMDDFKISERGDPEANLHGLGDSNNNIGKKIRGHSIRLPAAPTLPQMLEMERALRPLARRKPSKQRWELDEKATADFIATSGVWNIIQRPASERWLEGVFVVEQSPTMRLWQDTIKEFRQLIWRVGAFHWLETVHLDAFQSTPKLTSPINTTHNRHPLSICRPDASRIIFLCTDSLSNAWLSGKIPEWVALWSKFHSVVILQMLPEYMWRRTSLRKADFFTGSANTPLSTPHVHNPEYSFNNMFYPIPVVALQPESLGDLSKFLTASPKNQISCYWNSPTKFIERTDAASKTTDRTVEPNSNFAVKSFDRFNETVSPITLDLARYLAVVPLFLPIMRLIQYTFVPKSQSAHLAELFNSGILHRVSPLLLGDHPNQIEYDFLPGIREILLNQRSRPFISDVWKVLSNYIDDRFGRGKEFLSIILDPSSTEEYVSGVTDEAQLPFARVGATVLRRLGGEYTQAAAKLEEITVGDNKKRLPAHEISEPEYKNSSQEAKLKIEAALKSGAKDIDFSNLGLTEIPKNIEKLIQLEALNLSGNKLTAIPETLRNLVNLKSLNISSNNINILPDWLWQFAALQELRINNNQLIELPIELCQLINLTYLDISNNHLTSLSEELGQLVNLIFLNFENNQITTLPISFQGLRNLRQLEIAGNPLPIPPEITEKNTEPQIILDYYFLSHLKRQINESKILVVGQGSVGKTSLIQRLIKDTYNSYESKTEGVAINRWQIINNQSIKGNNQDRLKVNIWDFGGQEILHATHQFFLTKRSLYLLILDSRLTQEENRIEYWLKIIQAYSDESPVLIIGNKIDQHPLDIDRTGLQKKYPNIVGILETSAATGAGIRELKAAIAEQVNNLPHVRDLLPESWFTIKTKLEGMGRESNFIAYDKYLELCTEHQVSDEASQRMLIGFLHDLGVILHFQDDPRLESLITLNPQWVTNGVYTILNSNTLFQNKAILTTSMLDDILNLPEYPRGKRLFIVDMMKKFELCYDIEPDRAFLVPDLLPKDEPAELKFNGVPAFEYAYSVLPSSIITRFIVRMNQKINEGFAWRTGVVLKIGENKALVKADIEDRKITIAIDGVEHTRRDALSAIRYQLDEINGSIKGLNTQKRVPVPNAPSAEPIEYDSLLQADREGIEEITVEDGYHKLARINVRHLLNTIESETQRKENRGNVSDFTSKNYIFGDKTIDSSVFARDLQEIIYKAEATNINPQLIGTLKQLIEAVELMNRALPKDQAADVAEDLRKLVIEATKPQPNKKWYVVSIEGLIKAAVNLEKIGEPVINLSRKVLSLLLMT